MMGGEICRLESCRLIVSLASNFAPPPHSSFFFAHMYDIHIILAKDQCLNKTAIFSVHLETG